MASAAPAPEDIPQRDLLWTRTTIVILSGAGMLGLLILAASAGREFTAVLGIGLIVSGAAFTVGGLIGFLFAIPRCSTGIQERGHAGRRRG